MELRDKRGGRLLRHSPLLILAKGVKSPILFLKNRRVMFNKFLRRFLSMKYTCLDLHIYMLILYYKKRFDEAIQIVFNWEIILTEK